MIRSGPLANSMRLQAMRAQGRVTSSRIGAVTSYDPTNYAVVATLQPDNVQTGWLSIAALWVGNGWGMFAPPGIGTRIAVELIDGELDAGFAECQFFDNDNRPPSVPAGEFWLVHKQGQSFKLTNDGKLIISDGHGASVVLDGTGNIESAATTWTHTGKLVVSQDITSTSGNITASAGTVTGTTDVVGGGKSLKSHEHSGVQTGGGTSGPPV